MRRLVAVDRRLGGRGILGSAPPLDAETVRQLAREARLVRRACRRGMLTSGFIAFSGWEGPWDRTRDMQLKRWWTRFLRRIDVELGDDSVLAGEVAAWIGLSIEGGRVESSAMRRTRGVDGAPFARAAVYFERAAARGHAAAQSCLGHVLRIRRRASPRRLARAAELLRRAALQGDPDALGEYGYCLFHGEGMPRDERAGARFYRRAAELGDASAAFNLGLCCKWGHGVPRSISKAVNWWRRAARLGADRALEQLAWAYAEGPAALRDPARARYYARRDAAKKASWAALDAELARLRCRRLARAARAARA